MDFMLEEEMIDLVTFCLQNPESPETDSKKSRIKEIGKEIFNDTATTEIYTRSIVGSVRCV